MAGMIGRTLNDIFRVADLVGAGGFADVYLGRDLRTNTVVAIKILHEHFTRDPKIVERFLREAKIAEVLEEPHVVRVLGSGQDDDTHYIVMEYVQGLTLADMVHRNGPMAVDDSVGYVRQMLHALGHAHSHGIIHRDIKPQNVMVVAGGQVKVMDFGIAKDVDAGGGSQTTMYLGTPRYMSPEQANGAPASPRSDIYAVTITLYELLTGQPPFSANTPWQILNLQMSAAPPPITNFRSDVPLTIQQVIQKGLEKDPTRRFQTADEMIDALDHGVPLVGEPTMLRITPVPEDTMLVNPPADVSGGGTTPSNGPGSGSSVPGGASSLSPSPVAGTANGSGGSKTGTSGFTPVGTSGRPHVHEPADTAFDGAAVSARHDATDRGSPVAEPLSPGLPGPTGAAASPGPAGGQPSGRKLSGKVIGIGAGVVVLALVVVLLGPPFMQGFNEGSSPTVATPTAPAATSTRAAASATAPAAVSVATLGPYGAVARSLTPGASSVATANLDWRILVGAKGSALGQVTGPMGLAFDAQGNLYVADRGNNRIEKFSPDGKAIAAWGTKGIGPGQFDAPVDVAVDRQGNIFVLDSQNDRIQKLTPEGKSVGQWGAKGNGPGEFDAPRGIALDAAGNIYVADSGNNRIQKLSPAGQPLAQWGQPGVARDDFRNPEGVAVKANGDVVVADTQNNRVKWLSPQGNWIGGRIGTASANDLMKAPAVVKVDARGTIFALEWEGDRVQEISTPEKALAVWGQAGSAVGQFNHPHGMALDGKGHIYVSDSGNDRIEVATLP